MLTYETALRRFFCIAPLAQIDDDGRVLGMVADGRRSFLEMADDGRMAFLEVVDDG